MNFLWDKALDFLVSILGPWAVDSWRDGSAIDSYLSNLGAALPKARLLIERSECWRLPKYNPIDELLSKLKDSVYEAESIVDELEYQRLKNKVDKGFPGINFLKNWMTDFPNTVKGVLDRLNQVYNEMKVICDNHRIPENPNQFSQTARPITSTFLNTSNVYGRDKEFNEVIRLMGVPSSGPGRTKRAKKVSMSNLEIGESSSIMDKKKNVSVLSIVGMGGVGKTTLAQKVIGDDNVKSHFDLIMWVCVSDNSDSVKLTKTIIENATNKDCNLTNLDTLQKEFRKALNSKKFLLVLDDVWSKDWQDLLAQMKGASEGSVVLVTTRSLECVETPGTSISLGDVMNLVGLEEHIYWEFFKSCAFYSVAESNNINPELEDIGKEICKRLKGSPLAAKTIGGVLGTNLNVSHWTNIKDSEMWRLQKEERDILPVLQLSYQYLPSHLKKCFSFCSLYPKDFNFTQSELTKFWIMQGLIKPSDNVHQMRTLADDYFLELRKRCFFQKLDGIIFSIHGDKYVIHDLMHDVCQSITKDECFCLENGNSEHKVSFHIRHVSVYKKKLNQKEESDLCNYKKLLSLKVAYTNSCSIAAMKNWCNELKNIRSLSLSRCKIKELPENIGNLKHLQFLDISGTDIETLPESFCSLYNLQYLNMNDCRNIKCFPEGFNNLVNLLILMLSLEKVSLVQHVENIFEALQLYDQSFHVSSCRKIENLKNICKLNGALTIFSLESVPSKEAAEQAQLNRKPLLNRLNLIWSQRRGQTGDQSVNNENLNEEVLNGLCPHHNLKELEIDYYGGRNLPSWLKEEILPHLTEFYFSRCRKVSTISHLPCSITKLTIMHCSQLKNLQNCLEPSRMPALKHIEISNCSSLESLPVESFGGFVSLEYLNISNCSKLRCPNAVVLPPSVKVLILASCGDLKKSIPSCLQNLTSLKTLWILYDTGLESIPSEITRNLKSLSNLRLQNCSMLQSLGGLQFLASVQKVTIKNCRKLGETRGQDIDGQLPSELLALLGDS